MTIPKVFVSYSWDEEQHKAWVRSFASKLRSEGIDVILDQWQVQPGDQLPAFMEQSVRESDFVLIVCTPRYKEKSEGRLGGVAYEGDIIQGEVFAKANHRKFIPILRTGIWTEAAPSSLLGKAYIDLRDGVNHAESHANLLRTLHGVSLKAPPVGQKPELALDLGKPIGTLTIVDDSMTYGVSHLDVTPDGRYAVSSSSIAPKISYWTFPEGRRLLSIDPAYADNRYHIDAISIKADGQQALIVSEGAGINIYDLSTGKRIQEGVRYGGGIRRMRTTSDWKRAVCAGWQYIEVFEIGGFGSLKKMTTQPEGFWKSRFNPYSILCLAIDDDASIGITGSNHDDLKIWDLKVGKEMRTLYGHTGSVRSVAMSRDGQIAVSGSADATLRVWELRTGRELRTMSGHTKAVNGVVLSRDGTVAVSGSSDKTVRIWNVNTGLSMSVLDGNAQEVNVVARASEGKYIFSGADGNVVKMWEMGP
jgi:hypothetical protein